MQIAQRTTSSGIAAPSSGSKTSSTSKVDSTSLLEQSAAPEQTAAVSAAAPVARRGLSNWDQPLQDDISGAQQAVDFLEQSAAQLRALKAELSAKLANRQGRDGQVEARVRQFSDTWRNRQDASGGTLDSQLSYSSNESQQRFKVRGMTMGNLRHGARETLAIAVGNGAQGLRSVQLEPGLSDDEIIARFNQALAPVNISVSQADNGDLEFSTPESNWTNVRDTMAIQGGGIRYPTGQLNRVRTDPEPPVITPEQWHTNDTDSLRQTLQQVVQALAHVEAALSKVNLALSDASQRANSAMPQVSAAGMDQAAQNFVSSANDPSYSSLLSLTSALTGINRERVMALLGLRL